MLPAGVIGGFTLFADRPVKVGDYCRFGDQESTVVDIGLRYETTTEQLRFVIARLREMLLAHPKVASDPMFVRFMSFGAYSLDLEVFAQTKAGNWLEYRAIREDINFRIMEIVKEAGTGFAFPSHTSYFTRDRGIDDEQGRDAEEQVDFWRSRDKLPFPEFEQEDQDMLEDTLDYPPKGSPEYAKSDFDKWQNKLSQLFTLHNSGNLPQGAPCAPL